MRPIEHPEDLSPFLNNDKTDPRHAEIQRHLETCAECRAEEQRWRSIDAMFRTPELEIEVPPFQWQRIAACMEQPRHASSWSPIVSAWLRERAAWSFGIAMILIAMISMTGFEYLKYRSDQKILVLIAQSEPLALPPDRMGNPFRDFVEPVTNENPFGRFVIPARGGSPVRVNR